jgi:hypothetical protein
MLPPLSASFRNTVLCSGVYFSQDPKIEAGKFLGLFMRSYSGVQFVYRFVALCFRPIGAGLEKRAKLANRKSETSPLGSFKSCAARSIRDSLNLDLVAGSGLKFGDRGMHRLENVPNEWHLD